MKNFYKFKHGLCLAIVAALTVLASPVQSQVTVTMGTGTASASTNAFVATSTTTNRYSYNFTIYDASEILTNGGFAGIINKLAWYKDGTGEYPANDGVFKIYLKHVTFNQHASAAAETWASVISGATLVYSSNSMGWAPGTGWRDITLQTPFVWNGSDHLAVLVDWYRPGEVTAAINWQYTSVTNTNKWRIATTQPTDIASLNSSRVNLQLTFLANTPCTAPPDAGVATSSVAMAVCTGAAVNLGLTGNTFGTGQTYIWQSSANIGGPFVDISGSSTSPGLVINPATTLYYRAAVTCSGQTDYSDPVLVTVQQPLSGVYTINNNQPTAGTNFQSFAAVMNALQCGISGPVTFNVDAASGPYNEQISIPQVSGASAVNTITFNGNGRTIQAAPVSATRHVIKLDGADYVRINNLNLVGTDATYGWGVHITNVAENNIINNCTIDMSAVTSTTQSNSAGIVASGSTTSVTTTGNTGHNNTISNNTITGAYQSIIMHGNSANRSMNNNITGNTLQDFYATGIELTYHHGTIVSSNNIQRPSRTTTSTTMTGIEIGSNNRNVTVNANRIHDTHTSTTTQSGAAYGIYFTACDAPAGMENKVTNNLIYNFNSLTGTQYGIYNSSSDSVWYYHNTIVLDNSTSTSGTTRGFYQLTAATGIEFKNNLITVSRAGTGTKYAIYFGTSTSVIASDYNNLHIEASASNFTGYLTAAQLTLSDWQTASGGDANSHDIAPLFASPGSGNYAPILASLNDLGTNVGVTTDILDAPRSASTPDIGAYEFNVTGCVSPPTPGTLAATPNGTLCAGTSIDFTVTGNSIGTGQTYTLQSSLTSGTGFTDIGVPVDNPVFNTSAVETRYFRVAVTCGASTEYTNEVLITVPALFPAGTYTINSAVPTGGSNFQTFADAVNAIRCGIAGAVIFNVDAASGPYNEQVIIPDVPNTSAVNTIVFNGNGRTISFLSTNTNERAGIKLNGTDYVTISNFVINATGSVTGEYGFGIQVLGDADNNSILNNTININTTSTLANFSGIAIGGTATGAATSGSNTDNTLVSGNTVTGGNYGISLYGSSGVGNLINNNQIVNNIIRDQDEESIYVAYTNNTLVENNDISRPTRVDPNSFTGVYFVNQSLNARVSKNKMHNPFGGDLTDASAAYGIYFTGCDATAGNENIVSNNIIYNFKGAGAQYGFYNSGSDSVRYYHNSVALDDDAYAGTAVARGFYQVTTARGIEFKNNIIRISRGGTGLKHLLYFAATGTASTISSDRNVLRIITKANVNYTGYLALPAPETSYATLAEWQAASLQDANSLAWDPSFTDAATGNLLPQTVEIDNLGEPVGILTDILNVTRSVSTPDAGAYEFSGSIVVPVNLLNIFASKSQNDVLVNWKTAQEFNNSRFEIERSVDGSNFEYAGTVVATRAPNGSNYMFRDVNAVSRATGMYMYYRLKMLDIDNRFEYSPIALVKLNKELQLTVIPYPNPFTDVASLQVSAADNEKLQIQVFDLHGRIILTLQQNVPVGVSVIKLTGSQKLIAGTYVVKVSTGKEVFNLKLIKQ